MIINVIVDANDRLREKIKWGFTILLQPLRVETFFSDQARENAINIFYGKELRSTGTNLLCLRPSEEFEDCIKRSALYDISHLDWLEFGGKKLPKLFPVAGKAIDFDICAATFILASEFQDLVSLERDEFDRLRAMDSLQDRLGILGFPAVNYYSMLFKSKVEENFGIRLEMKKFGKINHALALTHDVDYTSSLNLRMIKRNLFGHAIINHSDLTPNERAMKLVYPLLALAGYDPPKIGLKSLRMSENREGLKSTFFIKTGATAKQDMNYNHKSRSFRKFLDSISDDGFEIGIHPSMKTYIDGDQLVVEKSRLERLTGHEVKSVRQHYLKFTASKTVGIWENAGMKYDGTLGFSRKAGFRNSIAFPFPLYNFEKDKISTVTELPLLIMDDTFSDNKSRTADEIFGKMKDLIDATKAAHGAASILFHNSLADPIDFPGFTKIYQRLLSYAGHEGFKMDSLAGIVENFR